MVLIIDNYDSFTFNLYQYVGELIPADSSLVVKQNDKVSLEEIDQWRPSHIIISPGPGTPERAGITLQVIKTFFEMIPILGVCLGHQAIGMVFGAKLIKAPEIFHGKTSAVQHTGEGILRGIPSPFEVMRYHSWIIDSTPMVDSMQVIARTQDDIPMAIQHKKYPLYGVQFHPESILTTHGKKIIQNFIRVTAST